MPSTRRSTRSTASSPATPAVATPAVPPAAPAPPAPPTPPDLPPPQPNRGTATFVPRSAQRDHLSCYAVAALGAPKKLDLTRVFTPDGLSCAVGSRTRLFIRLTDLVNRLPEVPGASAWEDIGEAAEILANARTGVGSVSFRQEMAKINLVEHVITLLLHHGLLLRSTHCVLLHGALETDGSSSTGRSTGGGGNGGGKGKGPATSSAGNPSAGVPAAIDLAGAASAGGGSGSGTGGPAGTGDTDADPSDHDKAFVHLVSQQQHAPEMAWYVMFIARVLRNDPPQYSWADLHKAFTSAKNHAALVGLEEEHRILKIALVRGDAMAAGGAPEANIHRIFSGIMPSVNGVSQTQFIRDQKALARVRKAQGGQFGGTSAMIAAPAQSFLASGNMMPTGLPGMQPYLGGTATPAHNPYAYGMSSSGAAPVTLPLGSGRVGGGTAPSARTTKKTSKKRQPLTLSTHELAAIDMANKAMQNSQQQYGPVPNGPMCNTCAASKRNPNHHHQTCAFSICHHCKRAGHRISKCPF